MIFLLLFFGWIVFSIIFAEVAPYLFAGIGYAIAWLFIAFWMALKIFLKPIVWVVIQALRLFRRFLSNTALFVRLLLAELCRGSEDEESGHDAGASEQESEQEDEPGSDPYGAALAVLGLEPGFTRQTLTKTYKRLMVKVHPDTPGGCTIAAQELNTARDLLMRVHGWT